jgi:hypothetical protein
LGVLQILKALHNGYHLCIRNTVVNAEPYSASRRAMLTLVRRKSCRRCGGDLSIECDIYGVFIECIQCGATYNKNDLKLTAMNETENTAKITPAASPNVIK